MMPVLFPTKQDPVSSVQGNIFVIEIFIRPACVPNLCFYYNVPRGGNALELFRTDKQLERSFLF